MDPFAGRSEISADACLAIWDRANRARQLYRVRTGKLPTLANLAPADAAALESAGRGFILRSLGGWQVLLGMRVYPVAQYRPGTVMVCRDDSDVVVGIAPGPTP